MLRCLIKIVRIRKNANISYIDTNNSVICKFIVGPHGYNTGYPSLPGGPFAWVLLSISHIWQTPIWKIGGSPARQALVHFHFLSSHLKRVVHVCHRCQKLSRPAGVHVSSWIFRRLLCGDSPTYHPGYRWQRTYG